MLVQYGAVALFREPSVGEAMEHDNFLQIKTEKN